jgi:hypothetical protein
LALAAAGAATWFLGPPTPAARAQLYAPFDEEKESAARDLHLRILKDIRDEWGKRATASLRRLRLFREKLGPIGPDDTALLKMIALEELVGAKNDLVRLRAETRRLRVEIGLKLEWSEKGWPPYAAALSSAPAPLTPVNTALVALLHDEFLASGRHVKEDIESLLSLDPLVAKEIEEIQDLEILIEGYRKTAKDDRVFEKLTKRHRERLALLKDYVLAYAQRKGEKYLAQLREKGRSDPKANLATLRKRYAAALALERVLQEEVQNLGEMHWRRKRVPVGLADVLAKIDRLEEIIESAVKKIDAVKIEQ